MEHNFEYISYIHNSINQDQVTNDLAIFVLNWHIKH